MLPTSIAGSIRIGWPSTVSPASTRADVDPLEGEVAARLDAAQVRVGPVGAGDVAARRRRRASSRIGTSAPTGPMKPAGPMRSLELLRAARAGTRAPSALLQLDLVDAVVAAQHHEHELAADDHREGLQQRARRHAERAGDGGDRGHARASRPARARRSARGQLDGLRLGARDLDVGGVAGRERDVVLARRARRHVLVRAEAAHHPDVGLDAVPLEPEPVEDPVVGARRASRSPRRAPRGRGRTCRRPS